MKMLKKAIIIVLTYDIKFNFYFNDLIVCLMICCLHDQIKTSKM